MAVLAVGVAVGIVAATLGFVAYPIVVAHHQAKSSIMQIWGPLLTNPNMVLISAGHTHWVDDQPPEPQDATVEQHILRPEARISLAAVQAISQVAGFLQTQHKQFRIHEAVSTNLQDLHGLPVVLIAGYNNSWTLRLLKPLRFHLTEDGITAISRMRRILAITTGESTLINPTGSRRQITRSSGVFSIRRRMGQSR